MTGERLRRLACLLSIFCSVACGNKESLGMSALSVVSAGVINDPANKSLRFDLLQYGLDQFCVEMRRRGAPIKLQDHQPVLGRFFADSCQSQVIDQEGRQSVVVRYSGRGYGWTNVSGRLGFSSQGLIEYAADFQLHDESLYIYFRPRNVGAAGFETLLVENAIARVGLGLPGVDASSLGSEIITGQLRRGFTVIRHSARGDTEFSTGLVPVGQRPFRPFQVVDSSKLTLDNDRTEVHVGQQDLIGGLHVGDDGGRLTIHVVLDGARAIDLAVLRDSDARVLLDSYITKPGGASLPAAPLFDGQVLAGQPLKMDLNLPPGDYALLFDHGPSVGRSNPPPSEPPAKIDYLVQLEDR